MRLTESIVIPDGGAVLFAGDSHLDGPESPKAREFLSFIDLAASKDRTLVLLGDLFYFYFESRRGIAPRFDWLVRALDSVAHKWAGIVLVRGNRDFLLGTTDTLPASLLVAGDWLTVDMPGGKRLLVTHGDLLITGDKLYRAFRAFMRSGFLRFFARELPVPLACFCADSLRWISFRRGGRDRYNPPDSAAALSALAASKADVIVIGHFHRPMMPGDLPDPSIQLYCIDEWKDSEPTVLVFGPGGTKFVTARSLHVPQPDGSTR